MLRLVSHRPLEALTFEQVSLVPDAFRRRERCTHCGLTFREAENLGQLDCCLHPGVLLYDTWRAVEYYSCCGATPCTARWPGCRRADHFAQQFDVEDEQQRRAQLLKAATLAIPTLLFSYGLLPPRVENTLYMAGPLLDERERMRRIIFSLDGAQKEINVGEICEDVAHYSTTPLFLQLARTDRSQKVAASRRLRESRWPSVLSNNVIDEEEPTRPLAFLILRRM